VVGYVLALLLPNPPVFKEQRYGFIAEMVVDPAARRSGTGRQLWERAKRWFKRKEVKSVQLNVSPLNMAGMKFWGSLGFKDFLKIQWCDLDEVDSR
jgi:ribosomal protein S18 acetylase RimI-like enzyme